MDNGYPWMGGQGNLVKRGLLNQDMNDEMGQWD